LKKVSTTTGDGVARAFLKAQASFFGSYRNALKIEPVSRKLVGIRCISAAVVGKKANKNAKCSITYFTKVNIVALWPTSTEKSVAVFKKEVQQV